MAGDFDKLFGDDWQPQDHDSLRRGNDDEPEQDPSPFPADIDFTSEIENRSPRILNEKEVKVLNVYAQHETGVPPQHFVLLRDNKGRRITIYVGQFEALAISLAVEGESTPRPMTHDLVMSVIEKLGATIDRVVIDDLWNDTFYAKICMIKPDGTPLDLDARSSDAIAIATRAKAPIYMAETVIEATLSNNT